jgi:hypothetical protein
VIPLEHAYAQQLYSIRIIDMNISKAKEQIRMDAQRDYLDYVNGVTDNGQVNL